MLTIYLLGFLFTFVFFWMFLAQRDYDESTDMFCSLVFCFTWPLWILLGVLTLFILAWKILSRLVKTVCNR